jgi:hypothetical protein
VTAASWLEFEAAVIARVAVALGGKASLEAEINKWPVVPPTPANPVGFAAAVEVVVSVAGELLTLTPEQALLLAPKFGEFQRLLTGLAEQAAALRDQGAAGG